MRVIVPAEGLAYLDAPRNFRHFSLVLENNHLDVRAALRGIGTLADQEHAWILPETVRALSPHLGEPDWEQSFAEMCAFAKRHGWIRDDGAIRAHVEWITPDQAAPSAAFRNAMRHFAAGVCIVACNSPDGPRGMTITAFSSVSVDPPMALICVNAASSSHDAITRAGRFSVNILAQEQREVATAFAGVSGLAGSDRFTVGNWSHDAQRPPVLVDVLQTIICKPAMCQSVGSHTVVMANVVEVCASTPATPLVNFDGAFCGLSERREQAA